MSDIPVQLIVAAFQDEDGAEATLKELKAAKKEKLIGIENAAVIRKDAKGKLHIKETADMGGGKGAAIGGVTGAAIGILTGGVGLVLGAVGAMAGGLAAKLSDGGFSDARLEALGASLQPGTSAIVAVIQHKWVKDVSAALAEEGADLMTMNIAADIAQQLDAGNEVAYSAVDTGEDFVASRVAGGEDAVDASQVVVDDESVVATHIVATEEGVAGERTIVTEDGESYEAGVATAEGAAYVAAVETDEGAAVAAVTATPAPDSEPEAQADEVADVEASDEADPTGKAKDG